MQSCTGTCVCGGEWGGEVVREEADNGGQWVHTQTLEPCCLGLNPSCVTSDEWPASRCPFPPLRNSAVVSGLRLLAHAMALVLESAQCLTHSKSFCSSL